eukprot:TRINITY_DN9261_c0_g1_i2.p1 TRINITY_DN9261_c0_g1~~TRINITY_DN9261_c0_g1_i2.p1  ORF type:complete len:375 (-),score=24.48 TRINITY_DN9261_c0_g1_i2:409-1533(-)
MVPLCFVVLATSLLRASGEFYCNIPMTKCEATFGSCLHAKSVEDCRRHCQKARGCGKFYFSRGGNDCNCHTCTDRGTFVSGADSHIAGPAVCQEPELFDNVYVMDRENTPCKVGFPVLGAKNCRTVAKRLHKRFSLTSNHDFPLGCFEGIAPGGGPNNLLSWNTDVPGTGTRGYNVCESDDSGPLFTSNMSGFLSPLASASDVATFQLSARMNRAIMQQSSGLLFIGGTAQAPTANTDVAAFHCKTGAFMQQCCAPWRSEVYIDWSYTRGKVTRVYGSTPWEVLLTDLSHHTGQPWPFPDYIDIDLVLGRKDYAPGEEPPAYECPMEDAQLHIGGQHWWVMSRRPTGMADGTTWKFATLETSLSDGWVDVEITP